MRDIDIRGYVPPFLLNYKELEQVYNTENPEFKQLDTDTDSFWDNQFIESTNEDGIKRYEKLLNIDNIDGTPLRERRLRVSAKWVDDIPYTMNTLKERLNKLCGEGNYNIKLLNSEYKLLIDTHLESIAQSEEVEKMTDMILPANMILILTNSFSNILGTDYLYAGGGVVSTDYIELTE